MTEIAIAKPVRELPAGFRLFKGGHSPPVDGQPLELCLDEAVAWMWGESHSASPACMCRVLATHGMRLNDRYDDEERQLLVPLLPRLGGTRSTLEVERRRSLCLVDAAVREIVPLGLAAVGWTDLADRLRAISPIVDTASARAANKIASGVRDEARKRQSASADDAAADAADAAATYATYAAADAAAAYATYAADAADAAAYAAAAVDNRDAAADAKKTPEERAHLRSEARRPIVLASIAAFARSIEIR